jgi:hypothetical protein
MNNYFSTLRFSASARQLALAGIFLCATWCRADDPPQRRMENRFLIVIDTSSAMKARSQGVAEAVNGLLESGMKGEVRKGDTIGLWTYSDHLDTDFPMEVWSEQKKDSILSEVREHVNHLRYEKRAHLDKALPTVLQVMANSERLTVILIFDGSEAITGALFAKDINALHKRYAREFRDAAEPFVTVMASRNGAVFDYTINYPATVVLPHTADPLPPPETTAPPVAAVTVPPPVVEPAPPSPTTNVQIVLSGADFAPKPGAPAATASNVTAAVTPTPTPAPIPPPVVPANVPAPVEIAPVVAQTAPANAAPAPPPRTPPPVVSTPPPAPVNTNTLKIAVVELAPLPPPAVTTPVAQPVASNAAVTLTPAEITTTTKQLTAMFVVAISLLTIAVVLLFLVLRRWRGSPQPSLISQSIDRSR